MFTISVNGSEGIKTDLTLEERRFSGILNGNEVSGEFVKTGERTFHLLWGDVSYRVMVLKLDPAEKSMVLKVNSVKYHISLKDKYDELLHRLGLDKLNAGKVNEVKAPMPGMVLKIMVQEGDQVKKGDALLVLEAMKMENIIKSPGEGVIRKIAAVKGTAVEKNQLLIQF